MAYSDSLPRQLHRVWIRRNMLLLGVLLLGLVAHGSRWCALRCCLDRLIEVDEGRLLAVAAAAEAAAGQCGRGLVTRPIRLVQVLTHLVLLLLHHVVARWVLQQRAHLEHRGKREFYCSARGSWEIDREWGNFCEIFLYDDGLLIKFVMELPNCDK